MGLFESHVGYGTCYDQKITVMINPFTIKLSLPLVSRLMELEKDIFLLQKKQSISDVSKELILLLLEEDVITTHKKITIDGLKSLLEDKSSSLRQQSLMASQKALNYILSPQKPDFKWNLMHVQFIYKCIKSEENAIKSWRRSVEFESDVSMPPAFMNVIFEYAPPEEIPSLMEEFAQWMGRKDTHPHIHPLLKIGLALPFFAIIAPFDSFNARMMRFLALDLLGFYGYDFLQRSTLIEEMMSHKACEHLYKTLKNLSEGEMDFSLWLDSWVDILQKTVDKESKEIIKPASHDGTLFKLDAPTSLKIKKAFEKFDKLSISELSEITEVNRNTLKTYLREHVSAGVLLQKGYGKLSWYELNSKNEERE